MIRTIGCFQLLIFLLKIKNKLKDTEVLIRFHPMPVYDGAKIKGEDLENYGLV